MSKYESEILIAWTVNGGTFVLTYFGMIKEGLSVFLLILTITYTVIKIIVELKNLYKKSKAEKK